MSIEDRKSSGDPSHPYFDSDPITREEEGFNTRADQPDPAGELGLDPDGLTSPAPQGSGTISFHEEVDAQDQRVARQAVLQDEGVKDVGRSGKPMTRGQLIWRRFSRSKTAMGGLIGFGLIVLFAIVGPYISPWEYRQVDNANFLKPPSAEHWFGTGQTGRDMFALTVAGLRKSLVIGLGVAAIQTVVAALVGSSAAFFGKWYDKTVLWIIDLLLVIPAFLLIAIITQKMGGSKGSTITFIFLLSAFSWMLTARVIRSMTLSVTNLDYVRAAKYMSVPPWATITKHILPNVSSYLIIDATLAVVGAVMMETFLSYFGFGVQPPETSLGVLLSEGQSMATSFPWTFLAPATVLVLMLVCINFIGDGLRDAIDPTSKSGGTL